MEHQEEKSTLETWAEREVRLACQHENPNWDGKSFDYGCSCYGAALEVYNTLCKQGHSGYSWQVTVGIAERLMHDLPLTPITLDDFGYISGVTSDKDCIPTPPAWENDKGDRHYNCPRKSSLFLTVHPDNTYELSDVDRFICVNIECLDDTFSGGIGSRVGNEMFPIQLPYYPGLGRYKIYTRTFLTDCKNGDFDTVEVAYIETPKGERVPVNRYFHEIDGKMTEITTEEYQEVSKHRIDTWERNVTSHISHNIIDRFFEEGEDYWRSNIDINKWQPDYNAEDYEKLKDHYQSFNYREIWWVMHRNIIKCHTIDDLLSKLDAAILTNEDLRAPELSRWGIYRNIAKLDEKLLEQYPSLHDVYEVVRALIVWTKTRYDHAIKIMNEYIKELDAIEDDKERTSRRKKICEQIEKVKDIIML